MKVKMRNDAGLTRSVSTGLSWTGFFFTGFAMMFRGMIRAYPLDAHNPNI